MQIVICISLFGTCLSQIVASAADAYYIHEHKGPNKRCLHYLSSSDATNGCLDHQSFQQRKELSTKCCQRQEQPCKFHGLLSNYSDVCGLPDQSR